MGYLIFLVLNNIVFFIIKTHLLFYCFLGVILVSISWELLENFYLDKLGIKFALRRDSIINAITDVCFFSLGGFYAMFNIQFSFLFFLVSTILFLNITVSIAFLYSIKLLGRKRVFRNFYKGNK